MTEAIVAAISTVGLIVVGYMQYGTRRDAVRNLVSVAILLVVADMVSTTIGLRLGAVEVVPGSVWVLDRWGEVAMHVTAGALVAALVVACWWWPFRRRFPVATWVLVVGVWSVLAAKAYAVGNNLVVIGGL